MRERAIVDLDQLPDNRFFEEVSNGLQYIAENAQSIESEARILADQGRQRGAQILRAISEEEAAKYPILLDAVRCPRGTSRQLATHLPRFNQHLAKGLYAKCCCMRPATFGELRRYIDQDREQYYLDGPNNIDWIFRNRILQRREESFYVDYVENDEEHFWLSPQRYDDPISGTFCRHSPAVISLVQDLDAAGFSNVAALALIAKKWRPIEMTDEFRWMTLRELNYETLKDLDAEGLLNKQPQDVYQRVVDQWLFPLYSLKLSEIKTEKSKLQEIQERWSPDGYW